MYYYCYCYFSWRKGSRKVKCLEFMGAIMWPWEGVFRPETPSWVAVKLSPRHWLNGHEFGTNSGRRWRRGKPGVLHAVHGVAELDMTEPQISNNLWGLCRVNSGSLGGSAHSHISSTFPLSLRISLLYTQQAREWIRLPRGSVVKNLSTNAGDPGSVPGSGRSPGERSGYPVRYYCLETPIDRGAWQTMGSQNDQTRLSN